MNKVTIIDKILANTFLRLIPKKVTPNHLTIFRFFTVPFVIYLLILESYELAIPLFIISALSDALDGARARVEDQVTEWGKMFDPVADKLLIGSTVAILVSEYISPIVALIIISFEVLIVISAVYRKKEYGSEIEAKKAGKVKMVCQSFGVGFLLLFLVSPMGIFIQLATTLLYVSIVFSFLSLIVYRSI
jgi:CDP-diacylglycerol--glycerol-3-phosphate 3-phosphatidyltransferase